MLCLNADVTSPTAGPVWEAPPDEWHRVLDINLGGVVNGLRTFVPRMLATGEAHHILITASLAGLATWPGGGPYAASKHAVVAVAEQAALALADTPITMTVLCPALVRSGMSEVGDDPADVAARALDEITRGTFAVVPDAWSNAIVQRGHRIVSGRQPQPLDETHLGQDHETVLTDLADGSLAALREDRSAGGPGFEFSADDVRDASVGGEPGKRAAFTLTDADGRVVERIVNHFALQGQTFVIVNTDAYVGDGGCLGPSETDASFAPEDLATLEQHLDDLIADSPLPAPSTT